MAQRRTHLLCTAVLVLTSVVRAEHRELYVKSTPDQQCPQGYLCLTLLDYLHSTSATFTTNTTLHFLPGNHSAVWPHNMTLVISNVSNLVLTGPKLGPGESPQTSVWCNYTMQFHFRYITDLAIRNILFTECGTSHTTPEKEVIFTSSSPSAALQFNASKNVIIESVHVSWSEGYGVYTLNIVGHCLITNCVLTCNGWTRYPQAEGNAYFAYEQKENFHNSVKSTLAISHTNASGIDAVKSSTTTGGITVAVHNIAIQYQLNVTLINCSFHNSNGVNMRIELFDSQPLLSLMVLVIDCTFKNSRGWKGRGLSLVSTCTEPGCVTQQEDNSQIWIFIINSFFIGNEGEGLYSSITAKLYSLQVLNSHFIANTDGGAWIIAPKVRNYNTTVDIRLHNSTFQKNKGHDSTSVLYLSADDIIDHLVLVISGCQFKDNDAHKGVVYLTAYKTPALLSIYDTHWYNNSRGQLIIYLERQTEVLVTDCTFQYGHTRGGAIIIDVFIPAIVKFSRHNITIIRTEFVNNKAEIGGGLYISMIPFTLIRIIGCVFRNNNAVSGGALLIVIGDPRRNFVAYTESLPSLVVINHTIISENSAIRCAGICIRIAPLPPYEHKWLTAMEIHSTQFKHNKGASVTVLEDNGYITSSRIIISDSLFYDNVAASHVELNDKNLAIINVKGGILGVGVQLIIIETEFIGNNGRCIAIDGSQLSLKQKIKFTNNTAYAGAAILLDCSDTNLPSILSLYPNTTVLITNNTAQYCGGGIAVNPGCYNNINQCFYHAPCWNQSLPCTVHMEGNSAQIAGNSIYGPSVDSCEPRLSDLFSIIEGQSAKEVVTFEQYSICFCVRDSINRLKYELELSKQVRPGQEITIQAHVCTRPLSDRKDYAIRAKINGNQTGKLGERQAIQEVAEPCNNLTYSVSTAKEFVIVRLYHDTITSTRQTLLKLTILPCPLGFKLDNGLKCDCADHLLLSIPGITCNITTNLINVLSAVWIGNYTDGKLVAHLNCPLDYCIAQPHSIDLQQQDLQCTNNRSGVLCGACKAGLSLTLGTGKCVDYCLNYHLFLIFLFALAGVLLVLLLLYCNLNVSVGTINALIFYANMIHVNRTAFFAQNNNSIMRFLAVFIAWLNLDLGMDTCFYKGMTAYANIWMQFVFPVYMWMLVFVIIYASRHSVTVSKLIGRNSVPTLATLFLLSYAKLLRTVIATVSPITIHNESGNTHLVWLMDGNVPFLRGKHAALFCMALLTVLLYILPLTLLTLLAPLLQARTHHPLLRWVVRIKPLLDAYQGPYKDKYRYWTGVMLTMRLVLFTVFATNTLGDSNINLFLITLAIILYLLFQMYATNVLKNHLNLIIECFYSLNLSVYASATILLKGKKKDPEHLTWVMVGSALAMFCFIITWHLYTYVSIIHDTLGRLKVFLKSHFKRRAENGTRHECRGPITPPPARQSAPTTSVIDMKDLREPLLTDN